MYNFSADQVNVKLR